MKYLNMKRLILILIALSVSGWGGVQLGGGVEAAAGGGGATITAYDTFASDKSADWEAWGGSSCVGAVGWFTINTDAGACHPKTSAYPPPSTPDHWIFVEGNVNGEYFIGPSFRLKSTEPTLSTEHNYVLRCNSTNYAMRSCSSDATDGGADCTDTHVFAQACDGTIEAQAVAVAGAGASTEICFWFWDGASGVDVSTETPENWGNADECLKDGLTTGDPMTLLAAFEDCEGADTTDCDDFGVNDPGNLKGWSDEYTNVALYSGSTLSTEYIKFSMGDLGL